MKPTSAVIAVCAALMAAPSLHAPAAATAVQATQYAIPTYPSADSDSYTIPEAEGVEYLVNGSPTAAAAGTHAGSGNVVIEARALDGYTLFGDSRWEFVLDADQTVSVTPADPQFGPGLSFAIPPISGVEYTVGNKVVSPGVHGHGGGLLVIEARALPGYELAEGSTARWSQELAAPQVPQDAEPLVPMAPSFSPIEGGGGTVEIPDQPGIAYRIAGTEVPTGAHSVFNSGQVTAHAVEPAVLAEGAVASWSYDFAAEPSIRQEQSVREVRAQVELIIAGRSAEADIDVLLRALDALTAEHDYTPAGDSATVIPEAYFLSGGGSSDLAEAFAADPVNVLAEASVQGREGKSPAQYLPSDALVYAARWVDVADAYQVRIRPADAAAIKSALTSQGTAVAPVADPGAGTEVGEPAGAAQDAPQADGALANTGATGVLMMALASIAMVGTGALIYRRYLAGAATPLAPVEIAWA